MIEDYKCPNCGASLTLFPSANRATCSYCNSNFAYHHQGGPGRLQGETADNPIGFTLAREETEVFRKSGGFLDIQSCRTLPQFEKPIERLIRFGIDTYTGRRSFEADGLEVRLICFLSTISGLSYSLKKTYSVEIDAGSFDRCDESEVKRKRKECRKNRDSGRTIDNILKRNATKQQECLNRERLASSYGFDIRETVRGSEWIYENELRRTGLSIPATAIGVVCTLNIAPDYFERFFPTIAQAYSRVQNRDEVRLIVERLLPSATWKIKDVDMDSMVPVTGWEKPISYHELGMNNAPDLDTALAIRLSVISQLIEKTSDTTGEYNWGLASGDGSIWNIYSASYSDLGCGDLKLKPQVRRVAQYNDW